MSTTWETEKIFFSFDALVTAITKAFTIKKHFIRNTFLGNTFQKFDKIEFSLGIYKCWHIYFLRKKSCFSQRTWIISEGTRPSGFLFFPKNLSSKVCKLFVQFFSTMMTVSNIFERKFYGLKLFYFFSNNLLSLIYFFKMLFDSWRLLHCTIGRCEQK